MYLILQSDNFLFEHRNELLLLRDELPGDFVALLNTYANI